MKNALFALCFFAGLSMVNGVFAKAPLKMPGVTVVGFEVGPTVKCENYDPFREKIIHSSSNPSDAVFIAGLIEKDPQLQTLVDSAKAAAKDPSVKAKVTDLLLKASSISSGVQLTVTKWENTYYFGVTLLGTGKRPVDLIQQTTQRLCNVDYRTGGEVSAPTARAFTEAASFPSLWDGKRYIYDPEGIKGLVMKALEDINQKVQTIDGDLSFQENELTEDQT